MKNQKVFIQILMAFIAISLLSAGCDPAPARTARAHHKHEKVKVYYYEGAYCYHDNNWVWYYLWMSQGNTSQYYSSSSYAPLTSAQLANAVWRRGGVPDEKFQEQARQEEAVETPQAPADGSVDPKASEEQVIEVAPEQTEQIIDMPENNSLDSMEGVPEANGGENGANDSSIGESVSDGGGSDSGGE